eukprot:CAMPEP_0182819514 /NCGR_PEP_ID=MMETSP0006_2-20121128/12619_1 /TAXON_ID=97485 /ORGANISM="Prymnesium parvum, Strain Texoma1" /LENGTH=63 /DNA_ID=CAMNT_0024946093 /DNA_START=393 /DNA_END=584 /DNA_ORIENTATION=+
MCRNASRSRRRRLDEQNVSRKAPELLRTLRTQRAQHAKGAALAEAGMSTMPTEHFIEDCTSSA